MKAFTALQIAMGLVTKPAVEMYWEEDWLLGTPGFSTVMSRNRSVIEFIEFNIDFFFHYNITKINDRFLIFALCSNIRKETVVFHFNFLFCTGTRKTQFTVFDLSKFCCKLIESNNNLKRDK